MIRLRIFVQDYLRPLQVELRFLRFACGKQHTHTHAHIDVHQEATWTSDRNNTKYDDHDRTERVALHVPVACAVAAESAFVMLCYHLCVPVIAREANNK